MAGFMDWMFGTADTAGSDAQKRQQGITTNYQTGVNTALQPLQNIAGSADQQGLFSQYLSGLQNANPQQFSVSSPTMSAPDVSASAVSSFLDPSIDYQTAQAAQGIQASAAGQGGLFSGAVGQELATDAQNRAQMGWDNAYNKAHAAGLDTNTATQGNFSNQLAGAGFNSGLASQNLANMGTAYGTAMDPLNAVTQNQLDMQNTLFGANTGMNQQQMQGQYADQGMFDDLLNFASSFFGGK